MDFFPEICCTAAFLAYVPLSDAGSVRMNHNFQPKEAEMTRDELNRELRMHSASWQAVLVVYGLIVGTLVLSAMAIVS